MKAIILSGPGGIENLIQTQINEPHIKDDEVLVQIKSISINPVDAKIRSGHVFYDKIKNDNPIILGWDISGIVTQTRSPLFKTGDEVFGMVNFPGHGKAYAEYVAAPAAQLSLKPANISHEEAAAATLAPLTALQAFKEHGGIKPGDSVLVTAASGGVGHYAVQLAKAFGAYVIGTSSATNRDLVLSLGANEHVDYKTQSLSAIIKDIDFVLDATDELEEELQVLKKGGRLTTIRHGVNDSIAAKAMALGVTAKNKLVYPSGNDMQEIANLMTQGKLRSLVSERFSFGDIGKAHLHIETGRTKGKIVVNL